MRSALASLCNMLMLVLLALGMTLPVSAWAAHEAVHGSQQMTANQHHHHDEATGKIAVHDHDDEGDEQGTDRGHDHMPGLAAAQADLSTTPVEIVVPMTSAPVYFAQTGASERGSPTGKLRRPPRFA